MMSFLVALWLAGSVIVDAEPINAYGNCIFIAAHKLDDGRSDMRILAPKVADLCKTQYERARKVSAAHRNFLKPNLEFAVEALEAERVFAYPDCQIRGAYALDDGKTDVKVLARKLAARCEVAYETWRTVAVKQGVTLSNYEMALSTVEIARRHFARHHR